MPGYPTNQQIIRKISDGVRTQPQATDNFFLYVNFVSLIETKKINDALKDADWIKVIQDELNEFKHHDIWTLVPRPKNKTIIGTR